MTDEKKEPLTQPPCPHYPHSAALRASCVDCRPPTVGPMGPIPPKNEPKEWEAFTINVTTHIAIDGPVWVVKTKNGHYVRQAGVRAIAVPSRRLATRFDSSAWASHVAVQYPDSKPVRLWTKAEREAKKWNGATWKASIPKGVAYTTAAETASEERT